MDTGKIVLGTLVGVTIGAIAGVLFAPASGEQTRRKIMDKGEDLASQIKGKMNHIVDKAKAGYEDLLHETDTLVKAGRENLDAAAKDIKTFVS